MSKDRIRAWALAWATAVGLAGVAHSQQLDGGIERAKRLDAVAAQKLEADTRAALSDATRLRSTDPALALRRLKEAVAALERDESLAADRRATLVRVVRDRLRVAESASVPGFEATAAESQKTSQQDDDRKRTEERKIVTDVLAEISRLRKAGQATAADARVAELAKKYPDDLSVQLLAAHANLAASARAGERAGKDADAAVAANLRDVDRSATPGLDDMQFPADWKDRTAKRRDETAPTADELRVLRSLETAIDARYTGSRFQDVIDHISTATNRTIIVDAAALTEAGVTYDTPVNFSARQPVAARTALRAVLGHLNLAFVVRDGIIHVTLPGKARDLMTTRVYYLGDLMTGLGPYGGAPTIGLALDQVQMVQNVTAIVEMITGAIDPLSWDKKGGQGSIGVNLPTMSLTVRQSQEVHVLLRRSLYGAPKKP